jgi:FkbM family methyltransferase
MAFARVGLSVRDKLLTFMLIAFETTNMENLQRRLRLRRLINLFARRGLVEVRFHGHSGKRSFVLRAGNVADYSVASEFLRGGYSCPDFTPRHIVDGGANIGLFSVTAADRFPRAQIDCYEPSEHNVEILERNLSRNGVAAVICRAALWSSETTVTFMEAESYSGFVSPRAGSAAGHEVPALLPNIRTDCWLKLDIEGAEYEVLPALFASGRFPRWISAELHNYHLKGAEIKSLLDAYGYAVFGFPAAPDVEIANVYAVRR